MRLKLNNLKIRNFKGLRDYELAIDGDSANVFGDNATGKTTLYDAFLWCLFGKNSADQSDSKFDWKPLDKDGSPIHHLETEVIAEIEVDGTPKKLSRMIEEKWSKKRGSAIETFSGHTTTYKIDDLTVKKKEYDDYLNTIADENLFKLLTNVDYFPEKMHWEERRKTLLNMVGDITDADVVAKNEDLEPLRGLLEERPADDLKKLTAQQMKQINKDINAIPDRIDEVDRGLPDISGLDKAELEADKASTEKKIAALQEQIAEVKNSDATLTLKNELREYEMHYRELEMDYQRELDDELSNYADELDSLRENLRRENSSISDLQYEVDDRKRTIERNNKEIQSIKEQQEQLRKQFYDIQQEQKEPFDVHRTTCPTCGQDLPQEDVLKAQSEYEKEVEAFNADKAKRLKDNVELGKSLSAQIEELEKQNETINNNVQELKEKLVHKQEFKVALTEDIENQEKAIQGIKDGQKPFSKTKKGMEITERMNEIKAKLKNGSDNLDNETKEFENEIKNHKNELNKINDSLQDIVFYERQVARKNELIEQEQDLSVKYGELEQRLHLLEEFTRTKVNLLTETINSRFKLVKFKLFEEQINGGLSETCEVTVDGNNYSTGLNNAMKINAGLDIINTLMSYYDAYVPVFVDNAESVNDLLEIDSQLITLSVSNHKNLRVEVAQ